MNPGILRSESLRSAGAQSRKPLATGFAIRLATLLAAALLASGCAPSGDGLELQRELQLSRETVERQRDQLAAQQATIRELNERLDTVRAIKPEDLQKIFYPERLVIDKLSGGYDTDGQPGHDGVVVYLRPVDAAGDTLKVAGEIRIQLFDLAAPPGRNLVGDYVVPVEKARELWYGKLMTQYYAVRCPWPPAGPPEHPVITVRATFIDYLTQRVLSDQTAVTVNLPQPATPS